MDRPAPRLFRQHTKAKTPEVKKHRTRRDNRQARRALHTWDPVWRRIRAAKLARNPLCECCEAKTCPHCAADGIRAATEVDHVDNESGHNDDDNLRSTCKRCHAYKTAREDGSFGRATRQDREEAGHAD